MSELMVLFALVVATIGLMAIFYSVLHRRNPYQYEWKYFILWAGLFLGAVGIGTAIGR